MIGIVKQRVFQARQKSADRHVHAMDLREQHSQRTPPICGSVSGGPRWTALCIGVLGHLAAAHDTVGRDGVVPQHFDERLSHVVGMHHAVAAGTHLLWVISMSPNRRLTLLVVPLFFARRRVQWLLQRKRAWQQGHPLGVKRA